MGDDRRSDAELIAAYDAGDARAFETLYQRHRGYVVALAKRFTGHDADALDVLQETFAYLHRKFPGFVLTCRLTTFLYPAVRNLSLDAKRKRTRSIGVADDLYDPPAATRPDADFGDLRAAFARLSEAHRAVVVMRFVDDLSLDEIAATLNVPVGTVKSRLHHALKQLREDPKTRAYFEG